MSKIYNQTDYRSILYVCVRVILGLYLLLHSISGLWDFDQFMVTALGYFPEESAMSYIAYLTPVIPFIEFFLAIMILAGIYTKSALFWAIGIGLFFMAVFHLLGDHASALEHGYSNIIKVGLFFTVYFNKFSLDYYNLWYARNEIQAIENEYL